MKFKNYIETESGIKDTSTSPGTSGQVLSSTVTGTSWITPASGNVSGTGTTNNMTKWINTTGGLADALMTDNGSTVGLSTNGGSNTFNLSHTSGSGIALNITKGGSGEALVLNKTSGSGNVLSVTGDSYFNGDVGIGTDNPQEKLHIYSTGAGPVRAEIESTQATDAILKYTNSNRSYATFLTQGGQFSIYDYNAASHRFYMLTNGNIGIGTTSPQSKLSISGGTLSVSGSGSGFGVVKLGDPGLADPYVGIYRSEAASIATSGNFLNLGGYDGIAFTTGQAQLSGQPEKMRITDTGNVGIGTTSPAKKLTVGNIGIGNTDGLKIEDPSNTAYGAHYSYNDGSTTVEIGGVVNNALRDCISIARDATRTITINTSEFVGIGTTNPNAKLEVAGSTRITGSGLDVGYGNNGTNFVQVGFGRTTNGFALIDLIGDSTYTDYGFRILRNNGGPNTDTDILHRGTGDLDLKTIDAGDIGFHTTSIQRMIVKSNGDVGIGDTTPSYKLDVNGTGRFTGDLRCLSLIQTSQRDQKKDIADIDKSKARAIPFKEYKYKSSIDGSERKRYGVVVEDIENDYPELVHTDADGIKGINYIDLLVKRVAELEKELEDISLTPGPKGSTGPQGPQGATGATGAKGSTGAAGNSHLSNVDAISFDGKAGQLVITINKTEFRFNPAK